MDEEIRKISKYYKKKVTEDDHCHNIVKLANTLTKKFGECGVLNGNRFRIGIAQKVLNLYLKYLWCLGYIKIPPHCPLDRRIIDLLKIPCNWTKLDDIKEYTELIECCQNLAKDQKTSIAEWELEKWSQNGKLDQA